MFSSRALFLFSWQYINVLDKNLVLTGLEPWTSSAGSNRSASSYSKLLINYFVSVGKYPLACGVVWVLSCTILWSGWFYCMLSCWIYLLKNGKQSLVGEKKYWNFKSNVGRKKIKTHFCVFLTTITATYSLYLCHNGSSR